ncbi:MAG TPA: glycosyltransferase family 1 protein [Flavobacteriales bacterium]|jgi:glycosyltransferase involved in cell wall biosynthesis|nr:glycosyltransferase family 1 protein [Flavobacteriales bacterium]
MRIGFDAKRLFKNFTGLGNYSRTLVSNLNSHFPDQSYFLYTPDYQENIRTKEYLEQSNIHIRTPRQNNRLLWRTKGVMQDIAEDGLDIYHGLSNEIPFRGSNTSTKFVVTIHDLIFKHYPQTYKLTDRTIYNTKFKYACKQADHIIAVSEHTRQDIVALYGIAPKKISVVHQSCNTKFFSNDKVVKPVYLPNQYLLYVGSVIERKNLLGIIEALSHLKDSEKIPLVVVGSGKSYLKKVLQRIKELKLQELIIFKNDIRDIEELKGLYQHAQMMIYPSFYEGFGIPIIESLLCETPVITSKTSALPEAAGPGAHYINPKQTQEIAEGIRLLQTDVSYRNELVSKGKKYVMNEFHPSVTSDKLMKLYLDLLQCH